MRDKDRPSATLTLLHYGIGNTFGLVHFANQFSETQEKLRGFTIRNYMIHIAETNGATAVLPYGVRARPEASLAAPITWNEIEVIDSRLFPRCGA